MNAAEFIADTFADPNSVVSLAKNIEALMREIGLVEARLADLRRDYGRAVGKLYAATRMTAPRGGSVAPTPRGSPGVPRRQGVVLDLVRKALTESQQPMTAREIAATAYGAEYSKNDVIRVSNALSNAVTKGLIVRTFGANGIGLHALPEGGAR